MNWDAGGHLLHICALSCVARNKYGPLEGCSAEERRVEKEGRRAERVREREGWRRMMATSDATEQLRKWEGRQARDEYSRKGEDGPCV